MMSLFISSINQYQKISSYFFHHHDKSHSSLPLLELPALDISLSRLLSLLFIIPPVVTPVPPPPPPKLNRDNRVLFDMDVVYATRPYAFYGTAFFSKKE